MVSDFEKAIDKHINEDLKMSDFKRDTNKYLVVKIEDVDKYLSRINAVMLKELVGLTAKYRAADGKPNRNHVCIGDNCPWYEEAWALVEKWANWANEDSTMSTVTCENCTCQIETGTDGNYNSDHTCIRCSECGHWQDAEQPEENQKLDPAYKQALDTVAGQTNWEGKVCTMFVHNVNQPNSHCLNCGYLEIVHDQKLKSFLDPPPSAHISYAQRGQTKVESQLPEMIIQNNGVDRALTGSAGERLCVDQVEITLGLITIIDRGSDTITLRHLEGESMDCSRADFMACVERFYQVNF